MLIDVLEEHLDEATFLWLQWERALVAPDFDLEEAATREERMLAHVEGLEAGGEPAAELLLLPALESEEEPTRLSSAALALLGGGETGVQQVLARFQASSALPRAALRRALELSRRPALADRLRPLLKVKEPNLQAEVLGALTFLSPCPPELLDSLLLHEDPQVKSAALRAAPRAARSIRREVLEAGMRSPHPQVRDAALEAGLCASLRSAWVACHQLVESHSADCREALVLLALGGDEREALLLVKLLEEPELRPHALWALGFSGYPAAAEACLEYMEDDRLAPLAGEAFSAITGLRLEGTYALPPQDESQEQPVPLEEDDLGADLVPKPEDELPWPEPRAVSTWWGRERSRFQYESRYLSGRPLDVGALLQSLEQGPMRRRHVLARELLLRSRGACFLQTRALSAVQRACLAELSSRVTGMSMQPLSRTLT